MSHEEADDITKFQLFGFLPELIARFNRIVPFSPLTSETLKEIIHLKIMNYEAEFEEEGFQLQLDNPIIDHMIEQAKNRQTGARGLDVIIAKNLEEVAFDLFGRGETGEITLTVKSGEVTHIIKRRA